MPILKRVVGAVGGEELIVCVLDMIVFGDGNHAAGEKLRRVIAEDDGTSPVAILQGPEAALPLRRDVGTRWDFVPTHQQTITDDDRTRIEIASPFLDAASVAD